MKRIRRRLANTLEHLEPRTMLTGAPELVRDINVEIAQPVFGHLIPVGDSSYFLKEYQLWVTDGTSETTRMVRNVLPAGEKSIEFPDPKISHYHVAGDQLYFVMENKQFTYGSFNRIPSHVDELWVTDGTSEGTVRLKTVPGEIRNFVQVEDKLFFTNTNLVSVPEVFWPSYEQQSAIWTTNGSPEGTHEVVPQRVNVSAIVAHKGQLTFATDDSVWTLDDTNTSSKLLNLRNIESLTDVADDLYITTEQTSGSNDIVKVFKSDGTESGTTEVFESTASNEIYGQLVIGDRFFFQTYSCSDDCIRQIWVSDGSEAGTIRIADDVDYESVTLAGESVLFTTDGALHIASVQAGEIVTAEAADRPSGELVGDYVKLDDTVYFSANDDELGTELHVADVLSGDSSLFFDLLAGRGSSNPRNLVVQNGQLFFVAASQNGRSQIWESDGTVSNTTLRGELDSVEDLGFVGETLLVVGTNDDATRLWKVATAGLAPLTNSSTNTQGITSPSYCGEQGSCRTPLSIVGVYGDLAYFYAIDGRTTSIWKSDGTQQGTQVAEDIDPRQRYHNYEGRAEHAIRMGATAFYTSSHLESGTDVWASDLSTGKNRRLVESDGEAHLLGAIDDQMIFVTSGETPQVWATNGTVDGTVAIADVSVSPLHYVANFAGQLYFVARDEEHGRELWKTDGTADGTTLVVDLSPGPRGSEPRELVALNDRLLFIADDGVHGHELWAIQEKEFSPPVPDVVEVPREITNVAVSTFQPLSDGDEALRGVLPLFSEGHELYFRAFDGDELQIWKTDGATATSALVLPPNTAGPESEFARNESSSSTSTLDFFVEENGALWGYDGEDFFRVHDSRGKSVKATRFVAANDSGVFFSGPMNEQDRGQSWLWFTDGTSEGTKPIVQKDVYAGEVGMIDDLIYCWVDGGQGPDLRKRTTELWVSDGSEAGTFSIDEVPGRTSRVAAVNGSLVFGIETEVGKDTLLYRPARIGDLDRNSTVDFADFLRLSSNYGAEETSRDQGDINGDGSIDFADFLLMAKYFGTQSSGQEVLDSIVYGFV